MKIQKKKSKTPIIVTTIVAVLLLVGVAVFAIYSNNKQPTQNPETTQNSSSEQPGQTAANANPEDTPPPAVDTDDPDKTPVQYDTQNSDTDPAKKDSLSGVINYKSVSNGVLLIRVNISQRIESGECRITLAQPSQNKFVTKSADIVTNPSSTTCKGFDIPVSELGNGSWDITINVTDGNRTGDIKGSVAI